MGEANQDAMTRRVIVEEQRDSWVRWLAWTAAFLAMSVVALFAYAFMTGVFTETAPKTFSEKSLDVTAEILRSNPKAGGAYGQRAETLYSMGRRKEAFEVLEQGQKAVGKQIPEIIYILRAKTMLLNKEHRYAEAEKVGMQAMDASDEYIAQQIKQMVPKGLNTAGADSSLAVDCAVQLSDAYVAQKKWDQAIKLYTYALMYEPTASDILTLRGWAYAGKSAEESATIDFKEALKYMPDNESALAGLKQVGGE